MATHEWSERLQRAIAEAGEHLARAALVASGRTGPPAPGDLYVLPLEEEAALEWLVLGPDPDAADRYVVVPVDDSPLVGTLDVKIADDLAHRPLVARCGQELAVPGENLRPDRRVDCLPEEALRPIRQKMAELTQGRVTASDEQRQTDLDPDYEDWLRLIQQARERLRSQGRPAGVLLLSDLTRQPPPELAIETPFVLAAESGEDLLAGLDKALAGARCAVRYHEMPLQSAGKLFLVVGEEGVEPVWSGPGEAVPVVRRREPSGQLLTAVWEAGPEGRLRRARPFFSWIDGQVVLLVGADSPQTVIVQR